MRPSLRLLLLPLLAAAPACGGDAAPASARETPPIVQEVSLGPWEQIPPDSLYGATAVENVRLTQVEIDVLDLPRGWDGMRIAAISDLQLGLWEENERVAAAAVQRALAARPDLIVLLGDYVAVGSDMEGLRRVLAPLRGRSVFAVLGDRDVRSDSAEARVREALSGLGIRVLMNEAVGIERNGDTGWIAGIDPDFATRGIGEQEYILATTGGPVTPLLLVHSPLLAARTPEGRRPAILAGNAFCGRTEVPGTPRLAWYHTTALPGGAVPEVERLFRIRDNTLFITCGVGYSFIPVRLGYPPEVALVTLRGMGLEQEAEAEAPVDSTRAAVDTLLRRYERGTGDTTATNE